MRIEPPRPLVPQEFSSRLKVLVETYGAFARNAYRMPMNSDLLTFPKQVGELDVYLLEEGVEGEKSSPRLVMVNLTAKEWGALTYYPITLGEDSAVLVGELVARSMARAFAKKSDEIGFNGDGSKDSFGILGIVPKLVQINGTDDGGGLVLGSGAAGAGWDGLTCTAFLRAVAPSVSLSAWRGSCRS